MIEVYMFVANWQQPFLAFPAMKARAAEIKNTASGSVEAALHLSTLTRGH